MTSLTVAETNDVIRSIGLNERLSERVANSADKELICQLVREYDFSDSAPNENHDFGIVEVQNIRCFFSCDTVDGEQVRQEKRERSL